MTSLDKAIVTWKSNAGMYWTPSEEELDAFTDGWNAALKAGIEPAYDNPQGFQFVQANLNNLWKGIILEKLPQGVYRTGFNGVQEELVWYKVLLVQHSNGRAPKSKRVYTYDSHWFINIEPIDISHINPQWYE